MEPLISVIVPVYNTEKYLTSLFGEGELTSVDGSELIFITKTVTQASFDNALTELKQHGEEVISFFRVLK